MNDLKIVYIENIECEWKYECPRRVYTRPIGRNTVGVPWMILFHEV